MADAKRTVWIAMPMRNSQCHFVSGMAHTLFPSKNLELTVQPIFAQCSFLTLCFNILWSQALNAAAEGKITHFAMIHDDVCPGPGWLDILLDEHDRLDADIVSAVVPIKDGRGLTSTAVESDDYWNPRRLTLKEVFEREETFTDPAILLNTGCWVCRMDRPWCQSVCFDVKNKLHKKDGKWVAEAASEDWDLSRQIRAFYKSTLAGREKLYATRKVQLDHERPEYTNRYAWGAWQTDEVHLKPTGRAATPDEG